MRRLLIVVAVVFTCLVSPTFAEDDTPHAAFTRKLLKANVTLECKDQELGEFLNKTLMLVFGRDGAGAKVLSENTNPTNGLIGLGPIFEPWITFKPDTKSGVKLNTKITVSVKDKPFDEVLNSLCDKNGWGYYVISKDKSFDDGKVVLKVGKERGYEKGKEPPGKGDQASSKGKDKTDAPGKADSGEKAGQKGKPVEDDERKASLKIKTAKQLVEEDKKERAIEVLEELLKKYPKSKAAGEAKELLEKLK